jgi:hypothetical protein
VKSALAPGARADLNENSIIRSIREVEAIAALEGQWQPVALYHVARGLRWTVREVLDGWTHPGWPGKTYQKPVIQKQYRCVSSARCRGGQTSTGSFS